MDIDYHDDDEQRRQQSAPAPTHGTPGGTLNPSADIARINQQFGGQGVEAEDAAKLERLRQQGTQSNGESYDSYLKEIQAKQQRRTAPTSDRRYDSQSSNYNQKTNQLTPQASQAIANAQSGAGRTTFNYQAPGDQFDDPYTKALEDLLKQQLASIQQPQTNPALDNLLSFLNTQFQERSQNPGYSPAEQSLLRTQALDPIEQDRAAAQRRSLERTASRGFMPSSGLAELDSREVDLDYDRLRGAAQRDLGVNAINRRDQNLAQAMTLGQLAGIQIPQMQRAEDASRRGEALGAANALYQLPRQAMQDSLSVINGSPLGGDTFAQAIQLMTNQQNQQKYNQQQSQAMWYQIGQMLAQMFG